MTVLNLCRVTVQTHCEGRSVPVDLVLPTRMALCEMLPRIVDIAGGRTAAATDGIAERWTMSQLGGAVLDESMTLHENGIRDGDILLLSIVQTQTCEPVCGDMYHSVVNASASADGDGQTTRSIGAVACLWTVGFGAIGLGWCGNSPASNRAVIAAILALAATAGSIMANRVDPGPMPSLVLGVTATTFAAVAGFLVVPGGPAPPNLFLAAAICCAVSTVLLRVTSHGTTCFIAIAAFSTTAAIAAAAVTYWPAPSATIGAVLAAASLAMLGVAAKLSIVLTGLSPTIRSAAESGDDGAAPACALTARAVRGHRTLTGLLAGLSASAALGAALVAADQRHDRALSGVSLTAVVSVVLLLRARQQRGLIRSAAVFGGGMVSASAAFVLAVLSLPRHAHWVCLMAVVLGVGSVCLTVADLGSRLSPVVRRSLELFDYVALAAVVPLTCWVGDVFGIVRGLSLP
jgi:type VII secretion integral membrane protein EccD